MAELADNGLNRRISDSEAIAKEVDAVEADIAELRMSYEQYFLGAERQPPTKQHAEVKKRIQKLKSAFVKQTASKFRIQTLQTKFLTYERLWARTLQEMENGTYRRDVFKAKLHQQQQKKVAPAPPSIAPLLPEADAAAAAPVPAVAAAPSGPKAGAGAPTRPAARSGGGDPLSEAQLKAVYNAYVTAKRRLNEDVSKLSYESVAANLRKQVPELMKKHNARGVEFKIVIKDGKAVLRAVPK